MATKRSNTVLFIAAAAVLFLVALHFDLLGFGGKSEGFAGSDGVDTFTMYYADWCPHCQSVKPSFQSFSKSGSVTVKNKTVFVQMVEAEKNPEKVKGKPVKGYPTFLLEKANGDFVEFDGERTPDGWTSWLSKNV